MKKKTLLVFASVIVVLFAAVGFLAGKAIFSRKATITILHVNDTHSQLEPIRSGEYAGMGGALALSTTMVHFPPGWSIGPICAEALSTAFSLQVLREGRMSDSLGVASHQ